MSECCSVNTTQSPVSAEMPCPVSGTRSKQVSLVTIQSLVRHLPFDMVPAQYYFCGAADCDVVYFPANPTAPTFHRDELLVRVGVKETHNPIPLCYCWDYAGNSRRANPANGKIDCHRMDQSRSEGRALRLRTEKPFR